MRCTHTAYDLPSTGPPEGKTAEEAVSGECRPAEPGGGRRTRRNDPDRRTRILDVTLYVIAEYGVAGTTHRHIAARADVPLGSVTYHFASLTDLQAQAFARHVERQATVFENRFKDIETHEHFVDVLVGLVHEGPARHRSAVLGFESHLAALRDPGPRTLTQTWTEDSRAFSPVSPVRTGQPASTPCWRGDHACAPHGRAGVARGDARRDRPDTRPGRPARNMTARECDRGACHHPRQVRTEPWRAL
ncbi:TetR family transcriptional regulator [Streptomyces sp. NPDC039022]|uniref:TetR/AcrR family transcriptional regulator n=1 Tax=Streptomyces sp. NPDC039022 TaxID=3157091 RepID=UPI003407A13F